MIDMNCVQKAIEVCLKYSDYQVLVVVNDFNDVKVLYDNLRQFDSLVKQCKYSQNTKQLTVVFYNNSVFRVVTKDNTARGIRGNLSLYDDAIDKKIINEVFRPMIRSYQERG